MQFKTGTILKNNGYLREIISIDGNLVKLKTIGEPSLKTSGRPPKTGIIKISSVKKWIKKKENTITKINKIQLTI